MRPDPRDPLLDPEEDPRVGDALDAIAAALTSPPDELTARRHRRSIAYARRTQPVVVARRSLATGAAAAVLVGALAVGGALPDGAQRVAADLAARVGIDLPRPAADELPVTDDRRPTPDTGTADAAAEAGTDAPGTRARGAGASNATDTTVRDSWHAELVPPTSRPGSTSMPPSPPVPTGREARPSETPPSEIPPSRTPPSQAPPSEPPAGPPASTPAPEGTPGSTPGAQPAPPRTPSPTPNPAPTPDRTPPPAPPTTGDEQRSDRRPPTPPPPTDPGGDRGAAGEQGAPEGPPTPPAPHPA
jgi:hypothetical protein